jgi:flagellar biosynthetic protein FliP
MKAKLAIAALIAMSVLAPAPAWARAAEAAPTLNSDVVRTAFLLTALSILPALFITMTSFVRIAVVLSMVRHAFGMPETPPNSVLVSLAVLLTAFVMGPTLTRVNTDALTPLMNGVVDVQTAVADASAPMRDFMLSQVREEDLAAIYRIAHAPLPARAEDVDILKLAPAFVLNELRVSFTIGFVILLPFLLIELVVASVLLSLGMMMVPPSTISLPIKLLMFVLIDGWALVIEGVVGSFH